MSLPFNTPTAFNLQSNRNGIIVFVELLRKNPVWTLSDFVKIQKIFEPLKRLHGAALSYFQKYTAPPYTFLRCAVSPRRAAYACPALLPGPMKSRLPTTQRSAS